MHDLRCQLQKRIGRWLRRAGWLGVFTFWLGLQTGRGEEKFSATAVKAAFVVNVINFVEWPASTNSPGTNDLIVGVMGDEKHVQALETAVRQNLIHTRKISVRKVTQPQEALGCNLVFLGAEAEGASVITALKTAPVLTISDAHQFAERGGIIELVTVGQNLRFDINLGAGQQAGLKLSSQILRLARRVLPPAGKAEK